MQSYFNDHVTGSYKISIKYVEMARRRSSQKNTGHHSDDVLIRRGHVQAMTDAHKPQLSLHLIIHGTDKRMDFNQ